MNSHTTAPDITLGTDWEESVTTFDEMGLKEAALRGVYSYGMEKPSEVQQKAIRPMLMGRDLLCQARSGAGKTATYAISIVQLIDVSVQQCQAIVVSPTRELAAGIGRLIAQIGEYVPITYHCCYGGTAIRDSNRILKEGVQVVVGTPGRLLDSIERCAIDLSSLSILVFDELDEIIARGFQDYISKLLQYAGINVRIWSFSATVTTEMVEVLGNAMKQPVRIVIQRDDLTLEGIRQYYIAIEKEEWKLEALLDLLQCLDITQVAIYCNTRRQVDELTATLTDNSFNAVSLHGDMTQSVRNDNIRKIRIGEIRFLVLSDLLSRGIDVICYFSLVVHYDLPRHKETYLHRIGRSGAYGRKGFSISFVTPADVNNLKDIEKYYHTSINELPADISQII